MNNFSYFEIGTFLFTASLLKALKLNNCREELQNLTVIQLLDRKLVLYM